MVAQIKAKTMVSATVAAGECDSVGGPVATHRSTKEGGFAPPKCLLVEAIPLSLVAVDGPAACTDGHNRTNSEFRDVGAVRMATYTAGDDVVASDAVLPSSARRVVANY